MGFIFNQFLHMSVDASILIAVVSIARFFMRKSPKYIRKILWSLVGLRLIIPFSITTVFSLIPKKVNTVTENVAVLVLESGSQADTFSALLFVPYIWLVVLIALLLYGVISYIKLKQKIVDAVLDEGNIYLSEKVDSPFVCGFIKPKIYIPYGIEEKTRECILHHERTHIKHGDHILKAIGFTLVCMYWFNPLVWVSYFLFCKDIEFACDESVIKNYSEEARKKYAKAIFELGVNKVKLSACPVAFGEVGVKERVKSTLNYKKVKRVFVVISVFVCVAIALCFMTEPKVEAAEKNGEEKKVVEEKTTEQVTETPIEPVTELVTEISTETEIESFMSEETNEQNKADADGEYTKSEERKLIVVNPWDTTTEPQTTSEELNAAKKSLLAGNYDEAHESVSNGSVNSYDGNVEGTPVISNNSSGSNSNSYNNYNPYSACNSSYNSSYNSSNYSNNWGHNPYGAHNNTWSSNTSSTGIQIFY